MAEPKIMASVCFKTRSGMSLFSDFEKFSIDNLDDFKPSLNNIDNVVSVLREEGFLIESQTDVGLSFSGPKELFEAVFKIGISQKELMFQIPGGRQQKILFNEVTQAGLLNDRISPFAESVKLASPGIPFHKAVHTVPSPQYYFIDVNNDIPNLLNASTLHSSGCTGLGVRISMIDTGIITRVSETHMSMNSFSITVDHKIRHVQGVWLSSDPDHTGTNYFTGGSFSLNTVNLGSSLPGANISVEVVYSCFHPHYLFHGYNIDDIRAIAGLDINTDEYGHGTAEAANILGVAPGAILSFVKYTDGSWNNFPLAGFQSAVQNQNPDIITCSWGTASYDNLLHLEIVNAVAKGITVIFSAGNGHTDNPGVWAGKSVSTPQLISVGGVYPINGGGFRASNYSSSFNSFIFTNPQRYCPDIAGLIGEQPKGILIMLPTEPGNKMDKVFSVSNFPNGDNTRSNDGWCVCSGTSASAPQVAGVVALLLEKYPGLKPEAVKNILQNSSRGIQTGSTNSTEPDNANKRWEPEIGFGLVNAQAAVDYLDGNKFNPFIRDSVWDNGTEPVEANRLYTSPDIILRIAPVANPQKELGITAKYRHDLSDPVEDGQDNYVYLRIQNRGAINGNCKANVYFTPPGMFSNAFNWTNIGQISIPNLEPGEFRVVGPLVWSDANIPSAGNFCLICILDSPDFPAPDLSKISTNFDFINMARNKNNVAWKNIEIKDLIPGGSSNHSFYIEGPNSTVHKADLHIDVSSLPMGSKVMLKVLKRLVDRSTVSNLSIVAQSQVYSTLHHHGRTGIIGGLDIRSNEKSKVTVYYSVPESAPDCDYPLIATLYIDGENVGKYTSIVRVSHFAFIGNRSNRELHRKNCNWINRMSPYNKVPFEDLERAHSRGYDNCVFCIGDSKR